MAGRHSGCRCRSLPCDPQRHGESSVCRVGWLRGFRTACGKYEFAADSIRRTSARWERCSCLGVSAREKMPVWSVLFPTVILIGYVYASTLWSDDPSTTLKRAVVPTCIVAGRFRYWEKPGTFCSFAGPSSYFRLSSWSSVCVPNCTTTLGCRIPLAIALAEFFIRVDKPLIAACWPWPASSLFFTERRKSLFVRCHHRSRVPRAHQSTHGSVGNLDRQRIAGVAASDAPIARCYRLVGCYSWRRHS